MPFIPNTPKIENTVTYFEDARERDGWQGQTTGKSIATLKAEVTQAIVLLNGHVTGFMEGKFTGNPEREGYSIEYTVATMGGAFMPGRIEVAALPCRHPSPPKREKSLRMALFMLRDALKGNWFLEQLSPGFSTLVPFMLVDSERTISQAWQAGRALPAPEGEFIEGEVKEANHA